MKSSSKFAAWAAAALLAVLSVTAPANAQGMVKWLADQGQNAIKNGKYKDAVGWFKRAEILVNADKDPREDGFLWEMIGFADWKAKDFAEAEEALGRARIWYEKASGAMSPEAARILDIWAAVYIDQRRYNEAYRLLAEALEWSEGKWTYQYKDIDRVPYRVGRLVYLDSLQGKAGGNWYAGTIEELSRIHVADTTTTIKLQAVIKQLFNNWKAYIDTHPSSSGSVAYNESWSKHFGTGPSIAVITQPSLSEWFSTSTSSRPSPVSTTPSPTGNFSLSSFGSGTDSLLKKLGSGASTSVPAIPGSSSLAPGSLSSLTDPLNSLRSSITPLPFGSSLDSWKDTPKTTPAVNQPFTGLGSQSLQEALKKFNK